MAYDENIYAKIVSGDLNPQEVEKLKQTGEWDEIQDILRATEGLTLPRFNKEKGYDDLLKRRQVKTKTRVINPIWIGLAASLLLLFGFLFLFNNGNVIVNAGMAEIQNVSFDDGTKIVLNDGSEISYKKDFKASERVVNLQGEASFEVTKGKKFVVETRNGSVEVLGTQFNVRAWGNHLYVECYEGSVKVSTATDQSILSKNESVVIVDHKMGDKNTIGNSAPLWQSGTLRFYEESLVEVFREMERQFDISIENNFDSRKFSGSFEEVDLEKALKQVCGPMGLDYQIDGKKIVIVK